MKSKLLVLGSVVLMFATTTICFAFDFESLDKKIENGELSHEHVKQIIDTAIQKGELTQEELKQHLDKKFKDGKCKPPSKEEFEKKLKEAGITKEELDEAHKKGPEAMKELFESHSLKLPPPPPHHKGRLGNKVDNES